MANPGRPVGRPVMATAIDFQALLRQEKAKALAAMKTENSDQNAESDKNNQPSNSMVGIIFIFLLFAFDRLHFYLTIMFAFRMQTNERTASTIRNMARSSRGFTGSGSTTNSRVESVCSWNGSP